MKFSDKISEDIKQAMRDKQKDRLEALRAAKTAFTLARTNKGAGAELTDEEELSILQKLVKQRKESAEIYSTQNRPELAEKELLEAGFLEDYLPEKLSGEELEKIIKKIIAENQATSMADMGRVMGIATKKLAGKADGKEISGIVRKILSN